MASSSSSNYNKIYLYDVFLSFSGEDTRKTFVDHLYAALDQHGICTFKDDERLEKGRNISDDLIQSIEESRLYIIVFSKKYASSSWCLNELLKIMECHKTNEHTAFPVFYDVDPSEVRKQNGLVGEALNMLKNKSESEVEKWKEALTDASNLSGWDVRKTADGHEAKVIKLIVERVSLALPLIDSTVDENLVGMEQRMQELCSCLEIGANDVRMIGIKGMGGAGKTTLARAIFDKLSTYFDGKSFVENVREKASRSGLEEVQKQVLQDVLRDKNITVGGVHEGKKLIRNKLRGKKVLIVLDDVDCKEQLEELARDTNWFKPGSRIIITTRDEQVLNIYTVKQIIDVTLLYDEEAICLFSRHAFRRNSPTQEYVTESREVVRYAAGLPLTIKVLGSTLRDKKKPEWKDALARLKTIPLKETLKKLELSYESLEDDCKEIFLDVACFLRYWDKDDAIRMLESCGFHAINGLRVLEQKSLIKIEEAYGDGYISMHDHIVEMGENIVRREHPDEPNRHSRLWVQEEIEHVLASDMGTEATRCIYFQITPGVVLESLKNMKKLRFLTVNDEKDYRFKDCTMIDEACLHIPNSLQYLYWNYYPHWCLPNTFEANNLVTLHMPFSDIKQLWGGEKVMKKLKFLNLKHTKLKSLNLGLMPNLERLDLDSCVDLVELLVYGGCLKSLVYLNLSQCDSLKSFMFIELLESLEVLHLDGLELKEFPSYITTGHSKNSLLELHLSSNWDIEQVPSSIGNLLKLESLNLGYCRHLKSLPGSIYMLKHLKTLLLSSCYALEELTDDVGLLESLEELDLSFCRNLKDIPSSICKLKHLCELNLYYCKSLQKLPDDLVDLECLQYLDIRKTGITHLPPGISLLKGLKIKKSEFKDEISEADENFIQQCFKYEFKKTQIQDFQHLRVLVLTTRGIEELPDSLGQLELLEELNLSDTDVKHLPHSICLLKHLKKLLLQRCVLLEKLPHDFGQLESLEELDLSYTDVKHLPDSICMLKHLKKLILEHCVLLEKLPHDFGQLESLEELYLSCCYSIRGIPSSICMLKQLKILSLYHCFCLEKLPEDIGQLESLEELYITRCYNITEIPSSISKLKHLKKLELEGCRRLEKLPDEVGDYIFRLLV